MILTHNINDRPDPIYPGFPSEISGLVKAKHNIGKGTFVFPRFRPPPHPASPPLPQQIAVLSPSKSQLAALRDATCSACALGVPGTLPPACPPPLCWCQGKRVPRECGIHLRRTSSSPTLIIRTLSSLTPPGLFGAVCCP